eukprot:TRINITY_DN20919_c0_g1_i2.p1 TRINITY_DN20919_c0_g1~~TRINITY_DN20919_c0_g1_i2.p1  ORF type:complete len:431 (+),score=87.21 TRINITY_DN20919_c0_g1_i2:133-1425(+)
MADLSTDFNFKLLQWNVLADGLCMDGFATVRPEDDEASFADRVLSVHRLVKEVKNVHKGAKLSADMAKAVCCNWADIDSTKLNYLKVLKSDWDNEMKRDLEQLADILTWENRRGTLIEIMKSSAADVIVLEELDQYEWVAAALAEQGYSSCESKPGCYTELDLKQMARQPDQYEDRLLKLAKEGIAFVPKSASSAAKYRSKRDSCDCDDDGVAIFWKTDVFECEEVKSHTYAKKDSGAIRVKLFHKETKQAVYIVAAHLPSGKASEIPRHKCLAEIHEGLIKDIVAEKIVFAGDLNSDVFIRVSDSNDNCFSIVEGWGFKGVWSGDANPITSVVKMRGPSSDQASKWGELAFETIDHVFAASSKGISLDKKFMASLRPQPLPASSEDREKIDVHIQNGAVDQFGNLLFTSMLPRKSLPSDHSPVLVDLKF